MPRLIDVPDIDEASELAVSVGDVLYLHVMGGKLRQGGEGVVELLGPFIESIFADGAGVLSPLGAPNVLLVRAVRRGRATVDAVRGPDPSSPSRVAIGIVVTG